MLFNLAEACLSQFFIIVTISWSVKVLLVPFGLSTAASAMINKTHKWQQKLQTDYLNQIGTSATKRTFNTIR